MAKLKIIESKRFWSQPLGKLRKDQRTMFKHIPRRSSLDCNPILIDPKSRLMDLSFSWS